MLHPMAEIKSVFLGVEVGALHLIEVLFFVFVLELR